MTSESSSPLGHDPAFRRLVRYLSLSQRFLLALVHAHTPWAADLLLTALPSAVSKARDEPVRLVRLDPYDGRPSPNAPLEQGRLVDFVLRPLGDGPEEDRARGVLQVIDGSRFLLQDEPAWAFLFGRMNEQRNAITQRLSCELLLLGPAELLDLFARAAPDFWSIRSGEFCEDLPENRQPEITYEQFEAARASLPVLPEGASPEALEAYCQFLRIPGPEPTHFLLTASLREPWRKLGRARESILRGALDEAATLLSEVQKELGARPAGDVASLSIDALTLHHWQHLTSYVEFNMARSLIAVSKIDEQVQMEVRSPPLILYLLAVQTLQLRAALQRARADDARSQASERSAGELLTLLPTERLGALWGQLGRLFRELDDRDAAMSMWRRQADAHRTQGDVRAEALAWEQIAEDLDSTGQTTEALLLLKERVLASHERLKDERAATATLLRMSAMLAGRGKFQEELSFLQDELLPWYQRQGHDARETMIWGRIAEVLEALGRFDEALDILENRVLPACRRLNMEAEEARAWGRIAAVKQARGDLDEALRILQERALPVLQRTGDVHAEAITWGRIADVFDAQGRAEEALAIRLEKALPVFQRLGDARAEVTTWGQIADSLQARGDHEQAMEIRRERELPVFQRLGDLFSEAITWHHIAELWEAQGGLSEAIAILRDGCLPIFQRAGTRPQVVATQGNLARLLLARSQGDDREQARRLLSRALDVAEEMSLPQVEQLKEMLAREGWSSPPSEGAPPSSSTSS